MGAQNNNPSLDIANQGWALTGATTMQAILQSSSVDTLYLSCPVGSGGATVAFPKDVSLPAGAVISSVSIALRCATGPTVGSVAASVPACVTVDSVTSDNPARFISRSIFPTSTISTLTVATYTRDASGRTWDVERLNRAYLRLKCSLGVADAIRVYQLYFIINYRLTPTLTVDAPTGTVGTPSPVLAWTYSQTDGEALGQTNYKIFTQAQYAMTSFDPNVSLDVLDGIVSGYVQSITLPSSLPPDTYWLYVRCVSVYGIPSSWVGRQFTVAGPSPGRPGDVLGGGSAGSVTVVGDATQGNVGLSLSDTSNLQSVQAASSSNNLDGVEFSTTNCTFVQDTTVTFSAGELASWALTPSSSADASATSFWIEVTPGAPFTERAQFLAKTATKSCQVTAQFADSTITLIGGADVAGSTVASSTSQWVESVATGTTPASAAYMRIVTTVKSATSGQVHNIDHIGSMYGSGSPYTDGGLASRNILSSWYATAEGTAPAGQSWVGSAGSTADTTTISGIGNKTHRLTYNGLSPTLALRAAGTAFTATTSGTSFTLNKPAGTSVGDLMLAFVSSSDVGTMSPPAGWTVVASPQAVDSSGNSSLWVLKRTAGGSEPSTWTDGSLGTAAVRRYAIVVGYSGAADASQQFLADSSGQSPFTMPAYLTNPTVSNTDPNAWRISSFAVSSPVTGGTLVSNKTPPTPTPISYVGAGGAWEDGGGYTSGAGSFGYIIYKPTGVVSGDLMVAVVHFAGVGTITPPAGWTSKAVTSDPGGRTTAMVMIRTAGASEPASWTMNTGIAYTYLRSGSRLAQCVAYRGVDTSANQFIAQAVNGYAAGTSVTTPSVTNTNSSSWRMSAFMGESSATSSWNVFEHSLRASATVHTTVGRTSPDSITLAIADSNAVVGNGAYTTTAQYAASGGFYAAVGFECFIKSIGTVGTIGANETQRDATTVGAAGPWLTTGVFDSNAVIPTGGTQATGTFTPGSGTVVNSMVGWNGIIRPLSSQPLGIASMTLNAPIDISSVDSAVLALSDRQMTVVFDAAAVTTTGTPYLTASFYRASVLISSSIAVGSSFPLYPSWAKSSATFPIPDGTTRVGATLTVDGRPVTDAVYFNKIGLSFGADATWRNGTAQAAHPIWSVPQIQFSDDPGNGFGDWAALQGVSVGAPAYDYRSGAVQFADETVIPLTPRKYRARTLVYGLAGDQFASTWSLDSQAVLLQNSTWWLKDLTTGIKLPLKVKWDDKAVQTTGTSTSLQALGEDRPMVVTEGYKGDTLKTELRPVNRADWFTLNQILRANNTLFLQSDYDQAWWVRALSNIDTEVLASNMRQANPVRDVAVTFIEVDPVV